MDIKSIFKKHWFLILFIAIIFLIVWYVVKGNSKTVTYYETHKDIKDGWSISKHIHVRERGGSPFNDPNLFASDIYFISSEGNCPMVDPEFNLYVFNDENVSMINYFTGVPIVYTVDEIDNLVSGTVLPANQKKALLLLYSLTDIGLNVRIVNYAISLGVKLDGNDTIADYFNAILRAELKAFNKPPTNEFDLKFLYLCSFLYVLIPKGGSYYFENILNLEGVIKHLDGDSFMLNKLNNYNPFTKIKGDSGKFSNIIMSGINEPEFKAITSHNII